jgi:hypothetical protein
VSGQAKLRIAAGIAAAEADWLRSVHIARCNVSD